MTPMEYLFKTSIKMCSELPPAEIPPNLYTLLPIPANLNMKRLLLTIHLILTLFSNPSWAGTTSPPLPPSQDPFYTAPPRFEKSAPGTILRIRPVPSNLNLTQSIPNCSAAYHILHRTTDTRYRPSWAITTLLLPTSYNPASSTPLLSYQIPYNSPSLDASPSYDFAAMAVPGGPVAESLARGWIVLVPDFEGPLASFGAGVQAGHATLDSIRAVLSLSHDKNRKIFKKRILGEISSYAMWGYSGGAVATEFAAELAVQYAPELTFSGAALGGVVPDGRLIFDAINRSPYAGDLPALLVGAMNQYPEAYAFLVGSLKESGPYNRTGFLAVERMTILQAFAYYAGQDVWEYFVQGREVVNAPVIKRVIERNIVMGYHGVPDMPLFVYQAVGDKFSHIRYTDGLVERYCGIGARIEFQRNSIGGHLAEIVNGAPRALEWLVGVFEGPVGDPLAEGCDIRTVAVNITDIPDF